MSSSMLPFRRIASNLLWTPEGLLCNPLITVSEQGRVLRVTTCDTPDREACVEFYAGVLVLNFPADFQAAFRWMCLQPTKPLPELLSALPVVPATALVVISGLDYDTMLLTLAGSIRRII